MLIHCLKDCKEFIAADGSILRELLHPDKADVKIRYSLAHARVPPGQATRPHRLAAAEVYYIVKGAGEMVIEDDAQPVGPGCAVYIPPGSVQYITNVGHDDLAFLCIVDPAWTAGSEEVLGDDQGPGAP